MLISLFLTVPIIVILSILLYKEKQRVTDDNHAAQLVREALKTDCENLLTQREQIQKDINSAIDLREKQTTALKLEQENFEEILKSSKEAREKNWKLELAEKQEWYQTQIANFETVAEDLTKQAELRKKYYEAVIEPIQRLQEEASEKRKCCIELTDFDKKDMNFLLKEVVPHINNRDVIAKLIWSTYVQKPLAETLKNNAIMDVPGIYKLTHVDTGKCYVGKSTTLKTRIQNHFKGACGISSISDQKIHHAMMEEGLDKWMIEKIVECEKEELSELEKYYIKFFNAQEYGYNVASGG